MKLKNYAVSGRDKIIVKSSECIGKFLANNRTLERFKDYDVYGIYNYRGVKVFCVTDLYIRLEEEGFKSIYVTYRPGYYRIDKIIVSEFGEDVIVETHVGDRRKHMVEFFTR